MAGSTKLMTDDDWKELATLTQYPPHNWGDPNKLNKEFIFHLDKALTKLNTDVLITSGTGGKHSQSSWHYSGLAADIMLPEKKLYELPDILIFFLRYRFNGVGIYNYWKLHARTPSRGGFHLDFRPAERRALWIGVQDKQNYAIRTIGMSLKHLNKKFR